MKIDTNPDFPSLTAWLEDRFGKFLVKKKQNGPSDQLFSSV